MKQSPQTSPVDFIGIGAPRCSTTWLAACLAEHPEICFASEKEPHFFDRDYNYDQGLAYYRSFFERCAESQLRGEFSPDYYRFPKAGARIAAHAPTAKLIMIVREPVSRAISHAQYEFRRTGVRYSLGRLLAEDPAHPIIENGRYHALLSAFLDAVGPLPLHVMSYDDCVCDPAGELARLYDFLGVDATFLPATLTRVVNAAGRTGYRSPFLNRLIMSRKWIKRHRLGYRAITLLKRFGVNTLVKRIEAYNRRPGTRSEQLVVTDEERAQLRAYYADDVWKFADLTGLNLTTW